MRARPSQRRASAASGLDADLVFIAVERIHGETLDGAFFFPRVAPNGPSDETKQPLFDMLELRSVIAPSVARGGPDELDVSFSRSFQANEPVGPREISKRETRLIALGSGARQWVQR